MFLPVNAQNGPSKKVGVFCLVGLGLEFNALHGLIACGKQTISTLIGCWRYYHLVFSGYDLIWANLDISEFGPDQLWLHQLDWPFVYLNHLQWMAMSWLRAFISFDEGPFQHLDHWMEVSYPCLVKGQIQSLGACLRLILHVVESSCSKRWCAWIPWCDFPHQMPQMLSLEVVALWFLVKVDNK